jgi:putative sterol carrier protein
MNSRAFISFVLAAVAVCLPCHATMAESRHGNDQFPQQVFDGMHQSFVPDRARGVHVRYQFDLSGPKGGLWWIEVNDGKCKFGRGRIKDPTVIFITSDQDWVALSNGKLPGFWAFLRGRLKIRGDQKLARKLDEMFP